MIKNGITNSIGLLASMGFGYLFHMLATRWLTVPDYGNLAVIISFLAVINLPISSFTLVIARKIAKLDKKDATEKIKGIVKFYIKQLTKYGIFIAIVIIIGLEILKKITAVNLEFITGLQIISFIIPLFAIISVTRGYCQGKENFKALAFLNSSESSLKVLFLVLLVIYFGLGFFGSTLSLLFAEIALVSGIATLFFNKLKGEIKIKEEIDFGFLPIMLTTGIIIFISYLDIFFVKLFIGAKGVGIYNVASITSKILFYLAGAVAAVILPLASKLNFKEHDKEIIISLGKGIIVFLLPVFVGFILLPKFIITLFYSQKYIEAVIPFMILSLGMFLLGIYVLLQNIFWSQHLEKLTMKIALVGLPIQVILLSIFVPKYGIIGAAISTTITSACILLIGIFVLAITLRNHK